MGTSRTESCEGCIYTQFKHRGGGALPYWVILGGAARMGEFSRPKTCGWVHIFDQKPADGS